VILAGDHMQVCLFAGFVVVVRSVAPEPESASCCGIRHEDSLCRRHHII